MSTTEVQHGSEVVSRLLRGAQFDTIRVYSLIVQLGFVRLEPVEDLPGEVWVALSGDLIVETLPSAARSARVTSDFFSRRALALRDTYSLIGQKVSAARVLNSGALEIDLGENRLRAERDEGGDLEEIWAVMSESPEMNSDHRWYVALDDSGGLSTRTPD